MRRHCLLLACPLILLACAHAPVGQERVPVGPPGVFGSPGSLEARATALVVAALAREGRGVLLSIAYAPWAGDPDRFRFLATFSTPPAPDGWARRDEAHGEVDVHTGGVEFTHVVPASPELPARFEWLPGQIIHPPSPSPER